MRAFSLDAPLSNAFALGRKHLDLSGRGGRGRMTEREGERRRAPLEVRQIEEANYE